MKALALILMAALLHVSISWRLERDAGDLQDEASSAEKAKAPTVDPEILSILGENNQSQENVTEAPKQEKTTTTDDLDLLDNEDDEKAKKESEENKKKDKSNKSDEPGEKSGNGTAPADTPEKVFLPEEGAAEREHSNSLAIFCKTTIKAHAIML